MKNKIIIKPKKIEETKEIVLTLFGATDEHSKESHLFLVPPIKNGHGNWCCADGNRVMQSLPNDTFPTDKYFKVELPLRVVG